MTLEAIGTNLTAVMGWIGQVITSLTSESGDLAPLLPLLMIGVSISALLLGVKVIRSFIWGA